jgi:hypothetical protein
MNFSCNSISIAPNQGQPHLTKAQKAFNNLIKQVEKKRAQLMAWEVSTPPFQQKYASELAPLLEAEADMQVEMVHRLDQACDKKGLTKTERSMIADLITELAGTLLADRDDEKLKGIYNKYNHVDYDSQEAAELARMKILFEEMSGVELGDDVDLRSPEDVMRRAQKQLNEKLAQEAEAAAENKPQRKKSAKQLAKEERLKAEAQKISQSIREVYRKLASALHPDRETDPLERERKTALMQRVNQAYEKNNLLQLLELQLELEHIDQSHINNLGEDRLVYYNKILKEQLVELEEEIDYVEEKFRMSFGIDPFIRLSPATLLRLLASDIVITQQRMREMKKDLADLQDIKKTKAWLKKMNRYDRMDYLGLDDCPF